MSKTKIIAAIYLIVVVVAAQALFTYAGMWWALPAVAGILLFAISVVLALDTLQGGEDLL